MSIDSTFSEPFKTSSLLYFFKNILVTLYIFGRGGNCQLDIIIFNKESLRTGFPSLRYWYISKTAKYSGNSINYESRRCVFSGTHLVKAIYGD